MVTYITFLLLDRLKFRCYTYLAQKGDVMKVLIINGSEKRSIKAQGQLASSLVSYWLSKFREDHEVVITEVDSNYNIQDERNKFLNADLVILHFPVFWFSVPGKTKCYIDDVFDSNQLYAPHQNYGRGGLLKGKYILSSTFNAQSNTFNDKEQFFDGSSIDNLFLPIHKAFEFIGLKNIGNVNQHGVIRNPDMPSFKANIDALYDQIKDQI